MPASIRRVVTNMDWTPKLIRLRNLLAGRYYVKDETFRLVETAGLPPDKISFEDKAVGNWHNILDAAVTRGRLDALVEVCVEDCGDVKLREAYEDYLSEQQVANRTAPPVERLKDQSNSPTRLTHEHVEVVNILFLAANPKDTPPLRLEEEVREIEEGLRRAKQGDRFIIKQKWAVRVRDIRRALLDEHPQIVHFSGHGTADGLVFESPSGSSQLVSPDALSGLFELFTHQVKCVLLNACYSVRQAYAISQHIDYVIGTNKDISDQAAIEFAIGFYDALGAGRSIEDAYKFGCSAVELEGIPKYMTPLLKMRDRDNKGVNERPEPPTIVDLNDPQRGRWGGMPERDGRKVEAHITNKTDTRIILNLKVISTDSSDLVRPVFFHLHDSYPKSVIRITKIREKRMAVLEELEAFGVFTVGVQVMDKNRNWVGLELDLARLPGLPSKVKRS